MNQDTAVSVKVVEEIAAREGTDPTELHPPLHTVIDTDALDALFESTPTTARTDGTVEFRYKEYLVQVDSSGEVRVGRTVSFTDEAETRGQSAENAAGD